MRRNPFVLTPTNSHTPTDSSAKTFPFLSSLVIHVSPLPLPLHMQTKELKFLEEAGEVNT